MLIFLRGEEDVKRNVPEAATCSWTSVTLGAPVGWRFEGIAIGWPSGARETRSGDPHSRPLPMADR